MKAIQILETGGPEVMTVREVPLPTPAPGQVLIQVAASGVNFIDIYVREGRYANKPPFTPGQEAAGTIVAIGDGVENLKQGDRVAWCSVLGTYAEYALAPAERVVAIPSSVRFEQAAAVMLQGMTAHYLSHSTYQICPGNEVLIHAGAGGVGLLLTQMAKALGARVFTTVSTEEKAALSRDAGADVVVNYQTNDFVAEIRKQSSGMHAVYDSVGKMTFEKSLSVLRPRGTLALFGTASGQPPALEVPKLAPLGSLFVTYPILPHHTATREELEFRAAEVFQGVSSGMLKLHQEHMYPLAEAAQAHRDLESRMTTGKLLLIP